MKLFNLVLTILLSFSVLAYNAGLAAKSEAPTTSAASVENETSKVNINTADVAGLRKVKGIGKVRAQAIIDYREKNGKFKSIEDLTNVKGIGKKMFAKIADKLTV